MTNIPIYSIDNGVPVPEEKHTAMPLTQLEVGDSFLFPIEKRKSVQTATSRLKKQTGRVFTIRKMDDKNARVWRIN